MLYNRINTSVVTIYFEIMNADTSLDLGQWFFFLGLICDKEKGMVFDWYLVAHVIFWQ